MIKTFGGEQMSNQEIREKARSLRVRHWEIAAALGISEFTLVRWLRSELDEKKRGRVLEAISAISAKRDAQESDR